MNSNWIGHQGVGVRGMVATRRGKKSHFGTCPGAHRGNSRRFWVGVSCKFGEVRVVLRKHGSCVYHDLYQFVHLCNQSVSGIHVQLQKLHPSACCLLDEDVHASQHILRSACIEVII